MGALPLVSCIMPTYGRPDYVNESVDMFLAQDYSNKELIILNDCADQRFIYEHPGVCVINESARFGSLGAKRNHCIDAANGSVIAVWDDDDIHLPWRLSYCVSEMDRLGTGFYRPAEFWAYWGSETLHDNSAVPGWGGHGTVMFGRDLWKAVGGYPAMDCGEDAVFFERIHKHLRAKFIKYDIAVADRFYVLRGTSHYKHMSINGGKHPLDTRPGDYRITPATIRDQILRTVRDRLVADRAKKGGRRAGALNATGN